MAAVSVVLPWSMWPMVPTLTWGLVRSNFFLAIVVLRPSARPCSRSGGVDRCLRSDLGLLDQLVGDAAWAPPRSARTPSSRSPGPASCCAGPWRTRTSRRAARGRSTTCVPFAVVHALDVSPPGVQVAHDVAHELLGHDDLDPHDGFEDGRVGALDGVLHGHRAGDLEGHLRGVHLVERAVVEGRLDVDHGEAGVRRRCRAPRRCRRRST